VADDDELLDLFLFSCGSHISARPYHSSKTSKCSRGFLCALMTGNVVDRDLVGHLVRQVDEV
jgi:hypothetical protein